MPVKIAVTFRLIRRAPSLEVDFTGSSPQIASSLNAVAAITYSGHFLRVALPVAGRSGADAGLMRPSRN